MKAETGNYMRLTIRKCFFICFVAAHLCFNASLAAEHAVRPEHVKGTDGEVITLEQAINIALENNRQVKNAVLEISKTNEQIAAARTKRYPNFFLSVLGARLLQTATFEFPKGSMGVFPGIGPVPAQKTEVEAKPAYGVYSTASVNQPLSQQYKISLNLNLLEAGAAIAKEKLRQQQQLTINDVKHIYYGILQLQSSLNAAKEAVSFYSELSRVAEQHVLEKTAMKSEAMGIKTRLLNSEKDVLTLNNAAASQKEQLNRLLGRDIRTKIAVNPVPDPALFETDIEEANTTALARRPEVKEARLKVKQAEYDRRIKKAEYIPDVSLTFNYISLFNISVVPNNLMSAGLLLTWDVFDWGRKNRELSEKSKTVEQAMNGVKDTEALVLMDVNNQFRKLGEARADIRVSHQALETAKENLRTTINKYTEKTALLKDVLEAQTIHADANRQYEKSLLALWTTRADFEKAMGEECR
jgi:outer membrane protein